MLIDFILLSLKFIGLLFLINSCIGLVFTLIQAFFFRNLDFNKSKIYQLLGFIFLAIVIVSNILIYTFLTKIFSSFYSTNFLTRGQLLLMLIPLFFGIALLGSIAGYSEQNFKQDYSKGITINFIQTFLDIGLLTLLVLQLILLIAPSFAKNLLIFFNLIVW